MNEAARHTEPSLIERLEDVIRQRRDTAPADSYVAGLLADGPEAACAKIIEEAYEVVHAVNDDERNSREAVIHEAADLVFHLLVLLGHEEIAWDAVTGELERRFGIGGLVEKQNRRSDGES